MQNWLNARCAQLLTDINKTPFTDDSDELKMKLIMAAMRESSVEMFHRAAENSRKEIEKINNNAMQEAIQEVEASMIEDPEEEPVTETSQQAEAKPEEKIEEKPEPKIKLSSSVIRRVDSF